MDKPLPGNITLVYVTNFLDAPVVFRITTAYLTFIEKLLLLSLLLPLLLLLIQTCISSTKI
jgi:hypothetical protein